MVATTRHLSLIHPSNCIRPPVPPSLDVTHILTIFSPPSTCTVPLVTWPLRRCSPAAGSDHQSVSWHSSAQRPLACKADSSNLWRDWWGGMNKRAVSHLVRAVLMSPHAQSAGSLSFKAAWGLHRKKASWVDCLWELPLRHANRDTVKRCNCFFSFFLIIQH